MRAFPDKFCRSSVTLLAALAVSSVSYAQTIDTGDWLYLKYGAHDLVVSSEENITYLDRNYQARRLDAEKRRSRKLWGKFKKLTVGSDGRIWGLSLKGNLYYLKKNVWRIIELKTKVDNFSVASDAIFIVSKGKIEVLTLSGKKPDLNPHEGITNARSIYKLTENKFVLLEKKGGVFLITPEIRDDQSNIVTQKEERKVLDKDVKNILFARKDIIAVRKDKGKITFHLLAKNRSKKVLAQNSANIKAMTVSADGRIWGASKRRIHYSPFTIEDLFKKLQHRLHKQQIRFRKLKKTRALRIFTGEDGTFRVNETGNLELWLPEKKKFVLFPGRVSELSVAGYGQLWGINALGRIFHFRSGRWEQRPGIATSISARAGAVMITDERAGVHRYDWKLKRFKRLKLKARTVAIQNQRVYWILKDRGKISRCNKRKCKNIQGYAEKISISPDGVVFIVDPSGNLLRFDGENFRLLRTPARRVRDVAAGIGGLPWIIDEEFRVHAGIGKKGQNFVLAGIKNPFALRGKIDTDNATQGVGLALLAGLVLKGNKLVQTADAPAEGFIFRKSMKFKRVDSGNKYLMALSMGRDGRLWALSRSRIHQFREADGKFVKYERVQFPSRKQPFLGLPKDTQKSPCNTSLSGREKCLRSIISDKEVRIYGARRGSGNNKLGRTFEYQEKRGGIFKTIVIPASLAKLCGILDITVDLDGNVYLAACNIFLKRPKDRRFELVFEKERKKYKAFFGHISAGPAGTLWATSFAGDIFELVDGQLKRKFRANNRFKAQDIDISVTGVVYVTSKTQKPSGADEQYDPILIVSNKKNLSCELGKWNVANQSVDPIVTFKGRAQFVAVSKDGTPWTACAPSNDRHVYRGRN